MESARFERTTIDIEAADKTLALRATGSVLLFDGFLTLYQEGSDDEDEEGETRLPKVTNGAEAEAVKTFADQHFTQPPPRYTEASLVKRLEELGIGRPSTYASTLSVLREREYVRMDKNRFIPEDKGRVVTAFLEKFFERYVEYDFTAGLEDQLDRVSRGDLDWKALLREFWTGFSGDVEKIGDLRIGEVLEALNDALAPHIFPEKEDGSDPRLCPSCNKGRLSIRLGKFGAFLGCDNYPDCKFTRPLGATEENGAVEGDGALGEDPASGETVYLKDGRFGPYVELALPGEDKPKRSSIPKGWAKDELTLESALKLLSLPRTVGAHPEDGEIIEAGLGRYGPFVKHGRLYANLPNIEEVFEIGLNRAVTVLAEKKAARGAPQALKELGENEGEPVRVMSGRYGPYIKFRKINATLPKDTDPETIDLETAMKLVAEKEAKGGRKTAPRKAPAKKKPATKKKAPAKKKAAAKKA